MSPCPQATASQTPSQPQLPQIDLAQLPRQGNTATYMGLVHQTIEEGKTKHLSKRSEQRIGDMQNRIALVLRQYQDINEIPPERRLRILESQRIIADILANARPNDWVCVDTPPTGSKLNKVQCATREDVEASRRSSKSWTEHAQGLGRP